MVLEKITTVTLRQKVYEQLRSKILGAELLPGEIISLRGLADKFGVSILPVREAVWQLESEKIVVVESNKRIQVNHLTSEDFKEVLNLRLLLESEAVDKACRLRPPQSHSPGRAHSRCNGETCRGKSQGLYQEKRRIS